MVSLVWVLDGIVKVRNTRSKKYITFASLSKKNCEGFFDSHLTRETTPRILTIKNKRYNIMNKTYSSSESSLDSIIYYPQDKLIIQKQPWSKKEIEVALSTLPGGSIALSLIPTLHSDAQKVLEKFQWFPKWPDTCLLISSWLGHVEIVKALLEKGVPVSTRDSDGRTPLHLAACATSTKIVEELLKHGAVPCKWVFEKKCTPLHCAAAAGCVVTVTCLIKSGADVNARRSPLCYAILNNAVDCVETLLQAGLYKDAFACGGYVHCSKLLLNAGAKPETRNSSDQTAMHLATLAQSSETIDVLISAGARVNAKDNEECTPLHVAVAGKNNKLVKTLIEAGASVNEANKFGYTPLHIAALNESSYIVKMLLSNGGDLMARTKNGVTALSFIVHHTPEALWQFEMRLDEAVSLHAHELDDMDRKLRVDFRPLVPLGSRNETDLVLCLVQVGQGHILKHPLCESFLHFKWKRIRKFFLLSLLFHLIFVAFFTGFVCATYLWHNKQLSRVLFWPVLTITWLFAITEIIQITYGICYYAKRWENWLQCSVIMASIIILIPPERQHHAALGILLAWIELMIVLGYLPMFGLYVQIFTRVFINFFKYFAAYFCLIIGFSLSFCVLHGNYKSFADPLLSMLKIIIMMSGELEFEDAFFDKDLKYPGTAYFILFCFVILVTMILMNLMVSLTMSDIQELRKRADLEQLVRHAELCTAFLIPTVQRQIQLMSWRVDFRNTRSKKYITLANLSKKNFEGFFGSHLTRETTSRIQTAKNKRYNIMNKTYSSSESSLESVICHSSQDESTTQKQPWSKEEIEVALSNLPGGGIALSLIPTFHGDALQKILEEFRCVTLNKNEARISPMFVDEIKQKIILMDENRAATIPIPGQLLPEWPDTCLLISSWLGHAEIVKALLEKGVPVSTRDSNGRTPLHLAACAKSTKIVEELLKHGADPCKWDFEKKCTPLHCAAAAGCDATVTCLIKSGADVNARRSPLCYAILNNAVDCVETLLQAGACPNNPQDYTKMPLHVAASLGYVYCSKLLLNAGAKTEIRNSSGQTAMHLATLAQSSETIDALISAGARVNARDNEECTPLHAAVASARKSSELIKTLIKAGASVNEANKFGYTPLHIAALNESSYIVEMLLSNGGNVMARTKDGVTALSFIVRHTPEVLSRFETRLDQAVSLHAHELGDMDRELRVNFRPLVPLGSRNETDLVLCLVQVGQGHILKHPLCESFLHFKWKRIRKFFLLSLLFHLIFVAFFTGFVCATYLWHDEQLSKVFFWPVLTITCLFASKEIIQITYGICYYAKRWENWLQCSVIMASIIILIPPERQWQHHVAALGILLAWIELMIVLGYLPMFGLYVQIFTRVFINFFKYFAIYFCLIIGFSLSFCVLHGNYKSFADPLLSMLKIIIMMSGELEFEDAFFDKDLKYPGTAYFILFCFVILVTVILMNLMVGLAVSDIQELRRRAGLERLVRHAEVIARFENMLFSKLLDYIPACKIIQACRKNILLLYPHHCDDLCIRPTSLPREIIQSLYRLAGGQKILGNSTECTVSSLDSLDSVDSFSEKITKNKIMFDGLTNKRISPESRFDDAFVTLLTLPYILYRRKFK
ncbi:Transient receptor potential channel pyrexia [Camponotus floridanus]|uniref:Transient receptor potential channel pyrexia n=1 Tax=Camponotus floridanus TaxID=104421 RepID=E2ACJ5_CAMFO|nr:Transient receptor potential channel pyrexia [Camponotus floridanus]